MQLIDSLSLLLQSLPRRGSSFSSTSGQGPVLRPSSCPAVGKSGPYQSCFRKAIGWKMQMVLQYINLDIYISGVFFYVWMVGTDSK